jgi:hypothetical protein
VIKGIIVLSTFLGVIFLICWFALTPIYSSFTMLKTSGTYQIGSLVILTLPIILVILVGLALFLSRKSE